MAKTLNPSRFPARRWTNVLKLAAVPVIFALLIHYGPSGGFLQKIALVPGLFLLALVMAQLGLFLFACRLYLVLRMCRLSVGFRTTLLIQYQSLFYYFVLPASAGQDVARIAKLFGRLRGSDDSRLASSLRSVTFHSSFPVVTDRAIGVTTLLSLGVAALFSSARLKALVGDLNIPALVAAVAVAALVASVALLVARRAQLASIGAAIRSLSPGIIGIALVTSAAAQISLAVGTLLVAKVAGIGLALPDIVGVSAVGTLIQVVPVSALGLSLGDAAAAGIYVLLGLSPADALIPVLTMYFFHFTGAFAGGLMEFASAIRSLLSEPRPNELIR